MITNHASALAPRSAQTIRRFFLNAVVLLSTCLLRRNAISRSSQFERTSQDRRERGWSLLYVRHSPNVMGWPAKSLEKSRFAVCVLGALYVFLEPRGNCQNRNN